jgi:hypothetical protein
MAQLGLDHPSDIQWKRICASDDMIDADVCDPDAPPMWRSSLALFKYEPSDESQVYDGRRIVYYKLAATITGYQRERDEVTGDIEWGEFDTESRDRFERLLDKYYRCTGALINATVGAPEGAEFEGEAPYIMDYEPKRRALYTMATETNSRMSRSLEQINVRKASGTTESVEALDVDLGESQSRSSNVQASGGGVGGGVGSSRSYSNSERVGTKKMNQTQEQRIQTSERSREQREGYSHTTQLTQLNHLLNSYHVGTNRALFLILPRPYTKETETGFVDGPRGVDGVQELFLVASKPEDLDELQVSARLDTSHLQKSRERQYEYDQTVVRATRADPSFPTESQRQQYEEGRVLDDPHGDTSNPQYQCYLNTETKTMTWEPEKNGFAGFVIDRDKGADGPGYDIVEREVSGPGSTVNISVDQEGEYIEIETKATSERCFFTGTDGWNIAKPDVKDDQPQQKGIADVHLNIYLQSTERTEKGPMQRQLLLTTRGLCCGAADEVDPVEGIQVDDPVGVENHVDDWRREHGYQDVPDPEVDLTPDLEDLDIDGAVDAAEVADEISGTTQPRPPGSLTIPEANALGTDIMKDLLISKSSNSLRSTDLGRPTESGVMVRDLHEQTIDSQEGRRKLQKPAATVNVPLVEELQAAGASLETMTRGEIVDAETGDLAERTELSKGEINRQKLVLMGVPVAEYTDALPDDERGGSGPTRTPESGQAVEQTTDVSEENQSTRQSTTGDTKGDETSEADGSDEDDDTTDAPAEPPEGTSPKHGDREEQPEDRPGTRDDPSNEASDGPEIEDPEVEVPEDIEIEEDDSVDTKGEDLIDLDENIDVDVGTPFDDEDEDENEDEA